MPTKLKPCPHCQDGEENQYGEVWYKKFPMVDSSAIYHRKPRILKTNGRYFLSIENFDPFQIKACPVCGRWFEERDNKPPMCFGCGNYMPLN